VRRTARTSRAAADPSNKRMSTFILWSLEMTQANLEALGTVGEGV
jgi:hypothetical protein